MLISDTTNLFGVDDIGVEWKLFVDKIASIYFTDKDAPLTFVEIGSLDGNDTLYFNNKYRNSECHCIEGLLDNYNKYLKHIKVPQIKCYNTCISSYNGKIDFHQKNINGIHGIYNRGNQYGTKKTSVDTVTFDSFCSTHNIDEIDIVKIDVEGATYDILESSKNNILKKIKMLHIETEDFPFFSGQKLDNDCEEILKSVGFMCICKAGFNPTPEGMQFDSVWINKNLL